MIKRIKHLQQKLLLALFVILCAGSVSVTAQNVIKKGQLKISFTDKQATFPGEMMVPKLEDDEGVIAFQISDAARKYISEDDVLSWIRSKDLKIDEIIFNESQARVSKGYVRLRYNYQFIGSEALTSKRLKIDSRAFSYNEVLNFYKQEVVFYTIDVFEPPKFDRDIFGSLQLLVQEGDGASVSVVTPDKKTLTGKVVSGVSSFSDLTEGEYQISITKSGYESVSKAIRVVPGQTPTVASFSLKRKKFTLTISSNTSGYDLLIVNSFGSPNNQLNQSSRVSIDLEPDKYVLKFTKQGFKDETRNVDLTTSSQSISVSMSTTQPEVKASSGSNNTLWYILLAAAAGGAAYYFTSGSGSGSSGGGGYGTPPALPVPFNK